MSKWKDPVLLLLGIGVSNVGAWVYFIAMNLIILDMTGSPLAVSGLYILVPLATLFTNSWAGSLVDRLNQKKLMIFLDIFRAAFIFSLPFFNTLPMLYVLVFIINAASSVFESASMVYMTKMIPARDRQRFNALRNFINSAGFILGPSIAGVLFLIGSPYLAIYMNAAVLCISALVIMLLPNLKEHTGDAVQETFSLKSIAKDWKVVLAYGKTHRHISILYVLFGAVTVFMSGLDSLETAFATGILQLSESTYGFLVSVAGMGIVAGSIINAFLANRLKIHVLIGFGALFTPIGYIIFSFSYEFTTAAIGFFLLTFALSFANTGFLTFCQNNIPVEMLGRFYSIFGILEAIMIILFTIMIGWSAQFLEIRIVYQMGSAFFLVLGFMIFIFVHRHAKNGRYGR